MAVQTPQFSVALLHPRYWLTWLGFGVLALTAQLPYSWQMAIGRGLGHLSYRLVKSRRQIAEVNIALCFPELSADKQQALVKDHFITNGLTMMEVGMAWFMSYSRLKKRFVVKGQEHWQQLKDQGQGALVIGLHFNTLEIANVQINRLFNLSMSYRPHKNPVYDLIQHRGRERNNADSNAIDRYDLRGMVKAMKRGDFLWYAPDQDYGRKVSEFVPWFGVTAATLATTPKLLRLANVPAVGLIYRRQPNYQGYEIEFKPVIDGLPSGDDRADLVALNEYIEDCVRQNPSEYLWVHRRFKTRPSGETGFYKK